MADSLVFEELLGCIGVVGHRQIRPEVVPIIAVLFPDEWNDSCAENCNVDLVVHRFTSWAKKQLSPLAHCDVDECVCMHITSKQIELKRRT